MGVRASVRRAGVVAAVCAVLALSACGADEPDENAEPKLPESSSTEKAVNETTAWTGKADQESVEGFVREWAREHTEMYNSGDTDRFRELSRGCGPCAETASRVESTYAAGGWVRSEAWVLNDFQIAPYPGNKAKWAVDFTLDDSGVTYRESSDSERGAYPATVTRNQVDVDTRGDSWVVTEFREFEE